MKHFFFIKIVLGYILVILVLSFLILLFTFKTIRTYYETSQSTRLKNIGTSLEAGLLPFIEDKELEELKRRVRQLGEDLEVRITVISPDGTVWADSMEDPGKMRNHSDRPEIIQALEREIGESRRFSTTVEKRMLYVALPIESHGKTVAVLRTSLSLNQINELLNNLKTDIANVALFVILVALVLSALFARTLTSPLRELTHAAQRVADGDFDTKIFIKNRDEFGQLAQSFNHMVAKIKSLIDELSERKESLNTLIASIQEGLAVLNKKGEIILSNRCFEKIVDTTPVEGKMYWEVLREPRLGDLVKNTGKERPYLSEEIEVNNRHYLCGATYMPAAQEIVLALHDITEMKQVQKIKKDFVVNVSHELRTPLSAILGAVETLEETVENESRRYLEMVRRNTERLVNIVNDLLTLSELEDSAGGLALQEVDLQELIQNLFPLYESKIKEKGLSLNLEVKEPLPVITADPFRLEQVFINLIDNAVKYTERGTITISVAPSDGYVQIAVKDTGIGIPRDHLSRVFERFYVVDKSRSRKLGGTGLGLSIVKHIVLLHNGIITVESTPGTGTKFTIQLPLNPS